MVSVFNTHPDLTVCVIYTSVDKDIPDFHFDLLDMTEDASVLRLNSSKKDVIIEY